MSLQWFGKHIFCGSENKFHAETIFKCEYTPMRSKSYVSVVRRWPALKAP